MTYYAKRIENDKIIAISSYDFKPEFEEGSGSIVITEEEYNTLMEEFKSNIPAPDPDLISDSQALDIILGGETA